MRTLILGMAALAVYCGAATAAPSPLVLLDSLTTISSYEATGKITYLCHQAADGVFSGVVYKSGINDPKHCTWLRHTVDVGPSDDKVNSYYWPHNRNCLLSKEEVFDPTVGAQLLLSCQKGEDAEWYLRYIDRFIHPVTGAHFYTMSFMIHGHPDTDVVRSDAYNPKAKPFSQRYYLEKFDIFSLERYLFITRVI